MWAFTFHLPEAIIVKKKDIILWTTLVINKERHLKRNNSLEDDLFMSQFFTTWLRPLRTIHYATVVEHAFQMSL